jgi:dephospho-CoA kinase
MQKVWLIGIGGTNASGKDTLAQHLVENHGYLFISTSDMIREVAMQREGNVLRPTLVKVSNEMRAERGAGVLVNLCIEKFKKSGNKVGLVASSIRTKGEVDEINKHGGIIIFTDAVPKIRYERLKSRQRADDFITFEEFEAQQLAEWHQSDNPGVHSIKSVKAAADYSFTNDKDEASFIKQLEDALFGSK